MRRSPKEQIATTPEQQLLSGGLQETAALLASDLTDTVISSAYSSTSEQIKRTLRKTHR
jgi:hypothetical protein